ncbi:MAG: class I SAM-dependent methyltransferase [Planctomycetota bacterium]|jgi:SAM-dependent methyltransferase|nr:class I SAM-dependent methyltransferase [Planctomycetota bacterium]
MKTEWDYTELADAYLTRPPYSEDVLNRIFSISGLKEGADVCDVGAGVAHLTIPLAERGFRVVAVEPNDAMRANGMRRTVRFPNVSWVEAGGEETKQPDGAFDLVSFGSSFNVVDRRRALDETHRILRPKGWFICMWNHRDLDDPIQAEIEHIIKRAIPEYGYGTRREDQSAVIRESGLFDDALPVEGAALHVQTVAQVVETWRSHATLHRQAGDKFSAIIQSIAEYLDSLGKNDVSIPYTTRAWLARAR